MATLDVIDRLRGALDGNYLTAALDDIGVDIPVGAGAGFTPTYTHINNRLRSLGLKLTIVAIGGHGSLPDDPRTASV
jgi:hypothetical protein